MDTDPGCQHPGLKTHVIWSCWPCSTSPWPGHPSSSGNLPVWWTLEIRWHSPQIVSGSKTATGKRSKVGARCPPRIHFCSFWVSFPANPEKKFASVFRHSVTQKKTWANSQKNGTIKWDQGTSACHHQCPWFWLMLWINPRVNQNRCESINQFHQNISESNQGRLQHSIQPLVYLWFAEWTSWWLCDMHNLTWWFIRYLFTILKINYQFVRKISGHWKCWPLWCHPSSCCLAIIVKQNFYMLDMPWSFKPRRIMYRMKQPLVWGGRTHIRIIESRYPQIHPGQKHPK